jgi:hypothetical protein
LLAWLSPSAPAALTQLSTAIVAIVTAHDTDEHFRHLIDEGMIVKIMNTIRRLRGDHVVLENVGGLPITLTGDKL